jgi:putative ABC transport system permease protein
VPDTFDILTPDAARGFVANLSERIGAAAGPISLMALLAAGVVVTNTVLVSVTQRTREIGVRRALGAPRQQIMREVLPAACRRLRRRRRLAGLKRCSPWRQAARPRSAGRASTMAWSLGAAAAGSIVAGWYPGAARRASVDRRHQAG